MSLTLSRPILLSEALRLGDSMYMVLMRSLARLVEWLIDDTPRIIMLDKTYDFLEAEGRATETGCSPDSNTCGSSGQNALDGPNWCSDSYPAVGITYYVAPTEPIDTKGDKSIIGVGDKGIIGAKGIRFVNDVSNIIIQNIHFTVSHKRQNFLYRF